MTDTSDDASEDRINFKSFDETSRFLIGVATSIAARNNGQSVDLSHFKKAVRILESDKKYAIANLNSNSIYFTPAVKSMLFEVWQARGSESEGSITYEVLRNDIVKRFVPNVLMVPPLGIISMCLVKLKIKLFGIPPIKWSNVNRSLGQPESGSES